MPIQGLLVITFMIEDHLHNDLETSPSQWTRGQTGAQRAPFCWSGESILDSMIAKGKLPWPVALCLKLRTRCLNESRVPKVDSIKSNQTNSLHSLAHSSKS